MATTLNNSTPQTSPVDDAVQSQTQTTSEETKVTPGSEYEVTQTAPEDLDMMWTRWKCLVCNYTYEGSKPLKKCPRCGNEDPDKFEDAD